MKDISSENPELLNEWNYIKNNQIKRYPQTTSIWAKYKVWWKCSKCGHEWESVVESRTRRKTGCPVCAGVTVVEGINDIKSNYPELAKEWDYDKNNDLGIYPNAVSKSSDKIAWWICPICNHSYCTAVKHRTRGGGCPRCANELRTSFPEQMIYYYLKKEFPNTENRWSNHGYEVDIYIPELNIGIEYDGYYYHSSKSSNLREEKKYDYLRKKDIFLIRVREKGLKETNNADAVIQMNKKYNDIELESMMKELMHIINKMSKEIIKINIDLKRDRQNIYRQYIHQKKEKSIEKSFPNIMKEWDYEKNRINPSSLVAGSERRVWWKCSKGHSYEQQVAAHINGQGCPYCAGKKAIKGETDLVTTNPELIKEWDFTKNTIKPQEVKAGTHKKVWWICSKGHSYYSSIEHRAGNGRGCPYCAGKKTINGETDLATTNPELIKEWDYIKNKKSPKEYTYGSMIKVWWKCSKGHSYEAAIRSRAVLNTNCPVCNGKRVLKGFNDFESQQPKLLKEWHWEKNEKNGIYPNEIHMHSYKKVWWKCSKCGNEWEATPGYRSYGHGCIICANNRKM